MPPPDPEMRFPAPLEEYPVRQHDMSAGATESDNVELTVDCELSLNVGLRPTPRLGRLRGPLRPAPLPRRRAVRA